MKKPILAALALLTLASCAKENSTTEPIDPNAPVAATFTSAAITRVADNAWETGNQIGITMVWLSDTVLATGDYENVPYTVKEAGTSGTFSAADEVIYFPVDDTTPVDFNAYYPYTADEYVDASKNIEISVLDQSYAHIDLVAAKATDKTKSSTTVAFTDAEAFSHQLSKLTMTIIAGDGVGSLTGLVTTIKGQYTKAEFNIYTFGLVSDTSSEDAIEAITTTTTVNQTSTTVSKAILLPTEEVSGSTIEFETTDGNVYILDTSSIAFDKGKESTYEITLTRTGAKITSSTIKGWGIGTDGELTASDTVDTDDALDDSFEVTFTDISSAVTNYFSVTCSMTINDETQVYYYGAVKDSELNSYSTDDEKVAYIISNTTSPNSRTGATTSLGVSIDIHGNSFVEDIYMFFVYVVDDNNQCLYCNLRGALLQADL